MTASARSSVRPIEPAHSTIREGLRNFVAILVMGCHVWRLRSDDPATWSHSPNNNG